VRRLLVRDVPGGLDLCTLLPEGWRGRGLEVHGAPTAVGTLSFAVRWHGPRPALLWDLELLDATAAVRLRAPGLDPAWSTTAPIGDALLAPGVADPDVPDGSFT
jgi:hypothetical protein